MRKDFEKVSEQEVLDLHASGRPGKLGMLSTKPLASARDLSILYSPGVAWPCIQIEKDADRAYDYTSLGNLVAVVTNGSAVLGLGDLDPLAAKPVMEGKAVLLKRFADIDAFDIELDSKDVDEVINCVRVIGRSFGGINLEDIKAPDCFTIEKEVQAKLDRPVFHDDQHGTAIVVAAGILNALELVGRDRRQSRVVVNGAGSAALSCIEMLKHLGFPGENILMCDSRGVVYKGRKDGMNVWKEPHAVETNCRSLKDAMCGADVFIGLSVAGAVDTEMVQSMAEKPIIFALANPDPEIAPELIREVAPEAIIGTGRSDYPNQVNNVLAFPYIFRGALDVRATAVTMEMKLAAVEAIAGIAREAAADWAFGPDCVIPSPFDDRLLGRVSLAVAEAAAASNVARKPIENREMYLETLSARAAI